MLEGEKLNSHVPITNPLYSMIESSGLAFSRFSNSIVYDIPEHPPCLTPILRHKSSFRSFLILFKCVNALSVKEIAGATPPDAGAAAYIRTKATYQSQKRSPVMMSMSCFNNYFSLTKDGMVCFLKVAFTIFHSEKKIVI